MNPINLTINASLQQNELSSVHAAVKNAVAVFLQMQQAAGDITRFTIQTSSDKLEHLHGHLVKSGLQLHDGALDILSNASAQYSVYRDIFINIDVYTG